VIDENIPFGNEAFSQLGTVTALPGRHISPEHLRHATALIVRSVTPVNRTLLSGSCIQFVGTATAGIDHVDREYLAHQKIGFADAAGSNANSVAEYVVTALVAVSQRFDLALQGKILGIVGVGRIGRLMYKKGRALGMEIILHDPPLKRETGESCYRSLEEVLQSDFLTLHVPLTREGTDKTYHLIGKTALDRMSSSTVLINTSRGAVVDNHALLRALQNTKIQGAILDVWEGEPSIDWTLVDRVTIATPHIAGYSLDGKINGTKMIYEKACQFFGKPPTWPVPSEFDHSAPLSITVDSSNTNFQTLVTRLAPHFYDLEGDDARMRALLTLPVSERPSGFDRLRKHYPTRREFLASPITIKNPDPHLISSLIDLGFSIYQFEK